MTDPPSAKAAPPDRSFYSWLLLVLGPTASASGWLAFNEVGIAQVFIGTALIPLGVALYLIKTRWLAAVAGMALAWWPWLYALFVG